MLLEELRAEALRLACQQVGPWKKGRIDKHMRLVVSAAVLFQTYVVEGDGAAMDIAHNRVREGKVVALVPKVPTVEEG